MKSRYGSMVALVSYGTNQLALSLKSTGCSSLEGFFQENGRIIWTWGQFAPTINPYSWVNLTNMLW
jgi:hypothetical protein